MNSYFDQWLSQELKMIDVVGSGFVECSAPPKGYYIWILSGNLITSTILPSVLRGTIPALCPSAVGAVSPDWRSPRF